VFSKEFSFAHENAQTAKIIKKNSFFIICFF